MRDPYFDGIVAGEADEDTRSCPWEGTQNAHQWLDGHAEGQRRRRAKAEHEAKQAAQTEAAEKAAQEAAERAKEPFPTLSSETRVIKGIRLPWQRVERTGPIFRDGENLTPDRSPKGTVLESGEVFIEMDTLYRLSEQDVWDSQFGSACLLGYHEGMALVEAGLAVEETRGGFHRTERLLAFIKHVEDTGQDA